MKYTASITIPMYLELDDIEIDAKTREEATRKILKILDENDIYHNKLCQAIESATVNLGRRGFSKNAEVKFYEDEEKGSTYS